MQYKTQKNFSKDKSKAGYKSSGKAYRGIVYKSKSVADNKAIKDSEDN